MLIECPGAILLEKRRILAKDMPSQMSYANYSGLVVKWGVELAGWTEGIVTNPGNIQVASALKRLLDALRKGHCYWRILTQEEWDLKTLEKDEVGAKSRKRRIDWGTTRGNQKSQKVKRTQKAGRRNQSDDVIQVDDQHGSSDSSRSGSSSEDEGDEDEDEEDED